MNIITPKMMIITSSIHRNEKIKKSYEKGTCRSYNYHRKFLAGAKQSDRQCCGFVSHCPYFIRDCQGDYAGRCCQFQRNTLCRTTDGRIPLEDRKSTRLNSSHVRISYAVFCLKKKRQE